MTGSFNKVMLMGNLTRDIEIRHTSSNTTVGNSAIAVNRKWKTQSGEQREEVLFIDLTMWGKTAEIMAEYLSKGRPVFVEGHLELQQWEDRNGGGNRQKIIMVVHQFQFVDSATNQQGTGGGYQSRQGQGGQQPNYQHQGGGADDDSYYDNPDIPF